MRDTIDLVRRTVETVAPTRTELERLHGPTPTLQRLERVIATQTKRLGRALG